MGGLAGSMTHLYGDNNLKLAEILKIISGIKTGDIKYNEKADGQNIFVTVTTTTEGQLKVSFGRNQTDFKNVGRSVEELSNDFLNAAMERDHYNPNETPAQVEIFGEGCKAIEIILNRLSKETFDLIFNDPEMPQTYINCEIIHADHPNLVLYEKNHIQFHELRVLGNVQHNLIDGLTILNNKFEKLMNELNGQSATFNVKRKSTDPTTGLIEEKLVVSTFTLSGPQFLPSQKEVLKPHEFEMFSKESDQTIENLKNLFMVHGLGINNTIADFLIGRLEDVILPKLSVNENIISDISHYLINGTDASGQIIQSKQAAGPSGIDTLKSFKSKVGEYLEKEIAEKLTLSKYATFQNGLINLAIKPLKEIIHNYALSILNSANSVIASNPELAKHGVQSALGSLTKIRQDIIDSNQDNQELLNKKLSKFDGEMELLGDISNFSQSMEGVIISYIREDGMPMQYKLTGNFAPANQLIGMSPLGFKTKRDLLNQAKQNFGKNNLSENKLKKMIKQSILKNRYLMF